MAEGIRFIRKGGRVIPIREDRGMQRRQGAARVVGGAALAAGSGVAAAVLHKEAALNENFAKAQRLKANAAKAESGLHTLFSGRAKRAAAQHFSLAARGRAESMRFGAAAKRIKAVGVFGGAALIASGIDKLLSKKIKKDKEKRAAIATASGLGSAFLIRSAYYRAIQPKLTTPTGKAINATWAAVKLAAKRVAARGMKF